MKFKGEIIAGFAVLNIQCD